MKAHLLLMAGFILAFMSVKSQQLEMYRGFGSTHFEYTKDTTVFAVSQRQVLTILKDDPLAYEEFKKGRTINTIAGVAGLAGTALIAIPLASLVSNSDPEWGLAAGGVALIASTIPLTTMYRRHAYNAIDMYNKKHRAFKPRAEYFLSGLGMRVIIRF